MDARGKIHRFGDDVDTDVIIPARYLNEASPEALASHCMEDIDPRFAKAVRAGDILVAGRNFGCGSSREHAPLAIKTVGLSCVIAASFARIFYRNAVNIGLPIMECPEAALGIASGDEVEIDFSSGEIRDLTNGRTYSARPFPPFVRRIIEAGGLVELVRSRLEEGRTAEGRGR